MTTRLAIAVLAAAMFLLGIVTDRAIAAPRPATVIPVPAVFRGGEPDQWLTEAPAGAGASPSPAVALVAQPTAKAAAVSGFTARATWYCLPGVSRCTVGHPASCLCAAASPDLHLRAKFVTVTYGGRSVTVRVVDVLASRAGGLDLYAAAFARLAPLSRGAITATFRVVG